MAPKRELVRVTHDDGSPLDAGSLRRFVDTLDAEGVPDDAKVSVHMKLFGSTITRMRVTYDPDELPEPSEQDAEPAADTAAEFSAEDDETAVIAPFPRDDAPWIHSGLTPLADHDREQLAEVKRRLVAIGATANDYVWPRTPVAHLLPPNPRPVQRYTFPQLADNDEPTIELPAPAPSPEATTDRSDHE